ncbi:MAG: nuclear transport factor 2 family protein [Microlunatus sp.]|nr:nuclear transport factor 2 family protein [Microlunatus sp.]
MTPLQRYIDAWVGNDAAAIADAVFEDCVIIECYGPVYRGRGRVRQWAQAWFDAGGVVHSWAVTDHFATGDREAAQWRFECTWQGTRDAFEGSTIATVRGDLIASLREYRTTAALYEWSGTWR